MWLHVACISVPKHCCKRNSQLSAGISLVLSLFQLTLPHYAPYEQIETTTDCQPVRHYSSGGKGGVLLFTAGPRLAAERQAG